VVPAARAARASARRAERFLNAGPPLAAMGAGLLVRHTAELEHGNAVASEITNEGWRQRLHRRSVPAITAVQAGHNLARIAAANDVTLFAHYSTDYAGHSRRLDVAVSALRKVDDFLGGLLEAMPDDTVVVIASDHGNLEDASTGHTTNPAIGMAFGAGHARLAEHWSAITDVTPSLLDLLGVTDES
jgi:phosphopentomutase